MIPVINEEQKTKPTQQAIKDVRSAGLNPDLVGSKPAVLYSETLLTTNRSHAVARIG
tara:strand:- start:1116 stop:1286 length:171 start_codon:yes stop_codon:yes gene_type:complete